MYTAGRDKQVPHFVPFISNIYNSWRQENDTKN